MNGQRKTPTNLCDARLDSIRGSVDHSYDELSREMDTHMQQIREELQAVREDIAALTEKLEPVIAMTIRVRHAAQERLRDIEAEEPEPRESAGRWQRWKCFWGGHKRSMADWTNENAYAECIYCGRVGKF